MQDTILKNTPKYNFVIQNFEGPLDLLLFLISKNKMSIFDISLSELTDEYVKYINEMVEIDLELTSEFIVMAATLLDIKAKKLLPELEPKEDEEEEISEQDIINRIIEYKKYKEIAEIINQLYLDHFGSFSKPFEKIKYKSKISYSGQVLDKLQLYDVYTGILERNVSKMNVKSKELDKLAVYEKVTVKDKVKQIVNYLKSNNQMIFNHVFNPVECDNIEVVTAFLGVLELSKLKQVDIEQEYIFSDINITKTDSGMKIDLSGIMG